MPINAFSGENPEFNDVKEVYYYMLKELKEATEALDLRTPSNPNDPYHESVYELRTEDYGAENKLKYSGTLDNEEYKFSIRSGYYIVLTQYVYSDTDQIVHNKYIKNSTLPSGVTLQKIVLVNNIEAKPASYDYTIKLNKGRNKIQILLFAGTKNKTEELVVVEHSFNFKEICYHCSASPKMKLINLYTLRYKSKTNNMKYFALDGDDIIVKYNPFRENTSIVTSKASVNKENEMRYLIEYKALSTKYYDKVSDVDGEKGFKIRLMASFVSSSEDVTPKLLSYRITGS